MTQEEKQLLLKDLCARLPYRTFAQWHHKALNKFRDVKIMKISTYGKNIDDYYINVLCQPESGVDYEASIVDIKPYLRPMSSMTKDEKEELVDFGLAYWDSGKYIDEDGNTIIYGGKEFQLLPDIETYDWLNKNHFDYRGLIGKGLAIDCSNLDIY